MKSYKILVITPVSHISGVSDILKNTGQVDFFDDPSLEEVKSIVHKYDAIFTNPNKSKVFLGEEVLQLATNLKVIATASTGTNHIDKTLAKELNIEILSLTEEREVINRISSTAEHALALTLATLRNIPKSFQSVESGEWDYTKFIGRQLSHLTVGVIGFGRLGSLYSKYCNAFGSDVLVYDPYVDIPGPYITSDSLDRLFIESDVISLHVHVNEETEGMIDSSFFEVAKEDVLIINTSRGDLINEVDLVNFLKKNKNARYSTDVIANEVKDKSKNPILDYLKGSDQIIVTPHIGGMTREAQEIAYTHAASLLENFLSFNK
tara:strand:- start:481 stop:1443 length:963 start_codon:yes stop_codon:yes gene_type:complete